MLRKKDMHFFTRIRWLRSKLNNEILKESLNAFELQPKK